MAKAKVDYKPIGKRLAKEIGRRSDIALVCAPWHTNENPHGMIYRRLNKHFPRDKGWVTLCGPQWFVDRFIIPLIRPRDDNDQGWMDIETKWRREKYK